MTKGVQLYVQGSLRTREWEDQEGNKRRTTEVLVRDVTLLGSRQGNGGGSRQAGDESYDNVPAGYGGQDRPAASTSGEITDDDIPF